MAVASESVRSTPRATRFAPFKKNDRNFFLLMVALLWLGILMGFVPDIIRHFHSQEAPYTVYTPYHAAAFVGWLVLLTAQVLLARTGAMAVHRTLGLIAFGLVPVMVVIGALTAFTADHQHLGTPVSDPAFLSVQMENLISFLGLAGAALLMRGTPVAHKRLMLLATIAISDAGFSRWWGAPLHKEFGDGFGSFMLVGYLGPILLVLLMGAYDYATRKRLHPAFVAGAIWLLGMETLSTTLYVSPWWKGVATGIIRTFG